MDLGLHFHEQLYALGSFVPDELVNLTTRIRTSWLIEHTENDGHAAITANSLALIRATGDLTGTNQLITFARPDGFGYGVSGDRFGLRSTALNTDEQLLLENIVVGTNSSAAKANVWLKAIGWDTTGAVTGATMQLRSEVGVSSITLTATSLFLTGALEVSGAVDLESTLNVDSAVTLQSTLHVVGAVQCDAALNVDGAVDFDSTLNVDGATTLQTTLHSIGAVTFDSTLGVTGVSSLAIVTHSGQLSQGTIAAGNNFSAIDGGTVTSGHSGTGNQNHVQFYNANGLIGTISTNGSATAYNTSSDKRLKLDLGVAQDFSALLGVTIHDFTWKVSGHADRGVFAQDERVRFSRAVRGGGGVPWQVDYSKFVPDLIGLVQQHEDRLLRLEQQ